LVILLLSDLLQASMTSTLDSMYKTEINDFFKVIRSQRHDYSFHLQAVYGLLAQKQYDKCLDYVKSVVADTQKISELIPISEIAISSMIMSFKQKAEQMNIVLNLSVEYNLDNICCSVYEINRIIGNLLQNALDETDMHKDNRAINLFILKRMGMAIIRVENPIDELHVAKEDMYKIGVTSKDRKAHEGIGMSTVKSIIEKYNGKIHIDFENGLIIISVYMPLK
jgi:sensor histidine kinase regulating citrate/malate metabolism